MTSSQKKSKDVPAIITAKPVPMTSEKNVDFLDRESVRKFLSKVGLGKTEQERLKRIVATDKSRRVEELFKCFQLATDTALVAYYEEEPAQWVDGYLGNLYDELVNVPQGA